MSETWKLWKIVLCEIVLESIIHIYISHIVFVITSYGPYKSGAQNS